MDSPVIVEPFPNHFDMENMCRENDRCNQSAADFAEPSLFNASFHPWRAPSPGRQFSAAETAEHRSNDSPHEGQQPQQQHSESGNNVRVIPIHVEGRDEPIVPSKMSHQTSQSNSNQSTQTRCSPPRQMQPQNTPPPHPAQTEPTSAPQARETRQVTPPPQKLGPIEQIKSIQNSVLELMSEVERFNGKPKDKQYAYLDEMLTRNLLKLDNVETEGKEKIRQARKEAVTCIQQCLNILEAKAKANQQLEKQLLEIDRLVDNITKSESVNSEESTHEKDCASMEVDAETNTEEKLEDVKKTDTQKTDQGEPEQMDTISEDNKENLSAESKTDDETVKKEGEASKN